MPAKLASRRTSLQNFGREFQPFFRWMFEMGKQIAALNVGAAASAVRTVPLQARPPPPCHSRLPRYGRAPFLATRPAHTRAQDGLALLSAALGTWSHFAKFKEFCETKAATAFTRDLWQQLGRFAQLVRASSPLTHARRR